MAKESQATRQQRIIRAHYGLTRVITAEELRAEIANLQRRAAAGTLDSKQEALAAALDITGGAK